MLIRRQMTGNNTGRPGRNQLAAGMAQVVYR